MKRRDGMSVFALGILFVLAMALMQGAQYFFLESVSDHSERLVVRQHAETLAQSAIAEALAQVSLDANQPGSALYDQLRGDLARENGSFDSPLAAAALPRSTAMLSAPDMRGISFDKVDIHLERHGRISPYDPMTYEGVITLTATVSSGGPLSDGRRHEVTKGFKVLQVAPMSPIGARPIAVMRPIALLTQPADINRVVTEWRERRMPNLRDIFERFIKKLEEAAAKAGEQVSSAETSLGQQAPGGGGGAGGPAGPTPTELRQQITQGKEAQGILGRVIEIYRELLGTDGYITQTEALLEGFEPFPDPRDSVLVAREPGVGIGELDLQRRFTPLVLKSQGEYEKFFALNNQVSATLRSDEPSRDESLYRSHVDSLFDYLNTVVKAKWEADRFRSQFEMLNPADTENMRTKWDSIDPAKTVRFSHLNTSSSVLLVEGNGLDVTGQLGELMGRLKRSGSGLFGNVFVRNPTQTLTLSGELTGKMTLFVAGGVDIQGLRKGSPDSVITVVVAGNKPVRVSGMVQANLVTVGTNLDLSGGPRIEGHLTIAEWFPQSSYAGTAAVDPAAPDPMGPAMRHVVISPWTRSRTFDEK